MSEARQKPGRRRNARAAKLAERGAPLPDAMRPVVPGQSSGRFKAFTEAELSQVNEAVLEVLETVGLANAIPSCIDRVVAAGGSVTGEGRLLFPRALVEDMLANCCREVLLAARDEKHDLKVGGDRVYFGTAGAAVHIVDIDNNEYRDSTLTDLYDLARLVDKMDNIHFFQRSVVARDMVSNRDLDINSLYACLQGTNKHVGVSFTEPQFTREALDMCYRVAGSEGAFRERPFVSQSNCFVVPPLRFAEDACTCLEESVFGGMPVLLLSAGQAGATSPASLAGSVVQAVAECLAGLVYVNLLVPGAPAIFGTWPFVSDLRTGAMTGGSGEQAILSAAVAQMGRWYNLPNGTAAGMTDAKMPDAQAGFEKGAAVTLAGHGGANMVYESCGMHGSLMGACFESMVIDNDMLGAINRTVRGVEVNEQTLGLEAIREVTAGVQHYLGTSHTMSLMENHYLYPTIGDRTSPKEWAEKGKPTLIDTAQKKLHDILSTHYPNYVGEELDAELRADFEIKLDPELMSASSRWSKR